jgi:hypothetical protein
MLNLTITITAAPELLSAVSEFTKAVISCRTAPAAIAAAPTQGVELATAVVPKEQVQVAMTTVPKEQAQVAMDAATNQIVQLARAVVPNQEVQAAMAAASNQQVQGVTPAVPIKQVAFQSEAASLQQSSTQGGIVPTTVKTYTMEQLAVAATELLDGGRREELVKLLQCLGVQALTALPKEHYGEFANGLRALGVKL